MIYLCRFGLAVLFVSGSLCIDGPQRARAQDADASVSPEGGLADAAEPAAQDAELAQTDAETTVSEDAAAPPVVEPAVPLPEPVPAVVAPVVVPTPALVAAGTDTNAPATEAIEVTVVGTKLSRTAGSAHVIRKKDLERFEWDDPTKVLLAVPGLYIRGEDGMGLRPNISIRGVDPDRSKKITLLEDGILFGPSPYSAPADYYFPLITRMEKVKVIKGPGTIAYGPQTVGGTIDLTTRSIPTRSSGGADVAVGQYGYGKAHVYGGSSNEQVGFLIEGVHLQNNGFKELPNNADTGFARNEWMVKGSYIIDPRARIKNELRLKLTYSDEVSNETYLGLTDSDFHDNPNQRYMASELDQMRNHRTSGVLTHQLDITPKLSITTNAYRHDYQRTWRKVNGLGDSDINAVLLNPGAYRHEVALLKGQDDSLSKTDTIIIGPNQRDFVSQGVESRLRFDRDKGDFSHRLEVGARYHYDSIDRRHSQSPFVVQNGELVPLDQAPEVWAYNKATTHAVALHAIYAGTWKTLTLTPGIRTELIHSSDNNHLVNKKATRFASVVLPGVGAFYGITDNVGVLAGVYEGFSPPAPGSPDSEKPEKSVNYEGGARFNWQQLKLEGIGYYNDYSNMTSTCTSSNACSGDNFDHTVSLGAARIYGVELVGDYELPIGEFKAPLQLSYTYTQTEYLQNVNSPVATVGNAKVGDEMAYIPHHQLRAVAGLEHARGGGNVAFTYVDKTRDQAGSAPISTVPHTDTQYVVDLAAFAKVWKTISVYATLQNLLDSRFIVGRRPFGARPNAPRWFQMGVKGSF